jgi:hypothetical protein
MMMRTSLSDFKKKEEMSSCANFYIYFLHVGKKQKKKEGEKKFTMTSLHQLNVGFN